ncbi:NACHT, LRR and PYD domains-containing protein 12-like isoform X2 [Brachyhypopomus gauderio]
MKSFRWHLTSGVEGFARIPKGDLEKADKHDIVDKMLQIYGSDGAVEITLAILKMINQNQLAEELQDKCCVRNKRLLRIPVSPSAVIQTGLGVLTTGVNKYVKGNIKSPDKAGGEISENINGQTSEISGAVQTTFCADKAPQTHLTQLLKQMVTGNDKRLNKIYTDLTIVVNETGGAIQEMMQFAMSYSRRGKTAKSSVKFNKIFKTQSDKSRRNRRVLTMGIAGVGKTTSINKFIRDWVKGRENQDIKYIFPLRFCELNLKKDEEFTLIELLNHCFFSSHPVLKTLPEDDGKVLFIFDGLDECRFPLCFEDGKGPNTVDEKASLGSVITGLIKRQILPLSLIWITCRPAAANLIPQKYIELVTEVRGFSYEQKEAFLNKYCNDDVGMKVFAHIKQSKNLHIMCQIPAFCWITATALQPLMLEDSEKEMPSTLTGMYINFLLQQKNLMEKKCQEDPTKTVDTERIILRFGKLAIRSLESGTSLFCEKDLTDCGIDVSNATMFSEDCPDIFSQHERVSETNIFSFTHLSVQEGLAALYVHYTQCQRKKNGLKRNSVVNKVSWLLKDLNDLHMYAVKKSLKSENGHLDRFLRFLLGLSLEENQDDLKKLLPSLNAKGNNVKDTVEYIKKMLNKQSSSDRSLNLFHCLNELNDNTLTSEIQNFLNSGNLSKQTLSPAQWSALLLVLLMSEEIQEKFELNKYIPSDEGLKRLLPVVKNTQRALLFGCNLTEHSGEALCTAMTPANLTLRELDISNNDLQDSGVKKLSVGLKISHCRLEILRLSDCYLTSDGCSSLALALSSNLSYLKELDLNNNYLGDLGVKRLEDSYCKLETIRLASCDLREDTCKIFGSVLQLAKSPLRELDLSKNNLQDSGVIALSAGLKNSHCKLVILRLSCCLVTEEGCSSLASALNSNHLWLKELDLSYNHPGDSGVNKLFAILQNPRCNLETIKLASCSLGEETCKNLASVLQLAQSPLKDLDLSNNDLQDSGVTKLSAGLKSTDCKLEILRLSGCLVTEKGCSSLASALHSSHLNELDLNYNYPGDSGVILLSAILEDQQSKLETLKVEHAGQIRIRPGLSKYACELTLDPNTAHILLSLAKGNRKVTCMQNPQSYSNTKHPDRFGCCVQVLCKESLSGRCYWEAEWSGEGAEVFVAYRGMSRKGRSYESEAGWNVKSWKLTCTEIKYSAFHNKKETVLPVPTSKSKRIAVYLDWAAGILSFYSVSSDTPTLTHLHTFHSRFTEPLYAGFGFGLFSHSSSVSICVID